MKTKTTKIISLFMALIMMMSVFAGFSMTAEAKAWKESNVLLDSWSGQLIDFINSDEYSITIGSINYIEMVVTSDIPMNVSIDPELYADPFKPFSSYDVRKYTHRFLKNRGTFTIRVSKGGSVPNDVSGNYNIKFYNRTPKPSIKKVTKKKKAFTVKWSKKVGVTGYQIQYSTNAKFKNAKKVTVKGADSTSRTIKKLKTSKKYYVRIRTFKIYDGKRYYSNWSAKKAVKTK